MVAQLRLKFPQTRHDRVQAVYTRAAAQGWIEEPSHTTKGRKARWHLPGTPWYLRASWHTTILYVVEGTAMGANQKYPTDALGRITLAMEHIALASRQLDGG